MTLPINVAYFSMEIALREEIPTYSGGLGVLAGDTIRAAADMKLEMAAVTLLHRKGYFRQHLDSSGRQTEDSSSWDFQTLLEEMPTRVTVTIETRSVALRAWKYEVTGSTGFVVPVFFLDSDLEENSDWDRRLTDHLYGGDQRYRLCQEAVLGIGGIRMLRALGFSQLSHFHMNEGHSSLLALELLDEEAERQGKETFDHDDVEHIRRMCVFTTHTPVPAGHDKFPLKLALQVLGRREIEEMREVFCCEDLLNMTFLGFNLSHFINGVAKKHGEVSRHLFAQYFIDSITNGVHAATWAGDSFQSLFDRHIPGWREDNFSLRYALSIPRDEIWDAHLEAKTRLINIVNQRTDSGMTTPVFTIGFGRRATPYKRPDLLFSDVGRLRRIAEQAGPFQVIYAGKAHPDDLAGKDLIEKIFRYREQLRDVIKIAYVEDYDLNLGRLMTSGADLWLNTPQPPLEASGTSGMKAAINGVPSLSVMDGWWIEGNIEGMTGWSIGHDGRVTEQPDLSQHPASLYDKLENTIIPLFYKDRDGYINVMLHCIALNGSFFNSQRMLQQYVVKAYFL